MDLLYALRDPSDGAIRYIGITKAVAKRMAGHRRECRSGNHHRGRWWRKVCSETGLEPTMHVLLRCNDLDWLAIEPLFIVSARYFGLRLTNSCDGGKGMRNPTADVLAKRGVAVSAAKKNRPSTFAGKKHSAEAKARMSVAAKARGISAEQREKIAASLRSMSDEAKALMRSRMSASHKARPRRPMSDETRARISLARKAFNAAKNGAHP
jgi:hypothetical protein